MKPRSIILTSQNVKFSKLKRCRCSTVWCPPNEKDAHEALKDAHEALVDINTGINKIQLLRYVMQYQRLDKNKRKTIVHSTSNTCFLWN
jgi:hypothetical protein